MKKSLLNSTVPTSCLPRRLLRLAREGRLKVAVVIGGAFQDITHWPLISGCHLILYIDVPAELDGARPGSDVIRVTLAEGQTIGTLVELQCPEELKKFLASRPGVSLAVGLAQLRAIGKLAVRALLADPTFEQFVRTQILDPLVIQANGSLAQVDLMAFAGAAGGTGGPVANVVLGAIAQVILHRSEAIVRKIVIRSGSLSYVSLGERVHSNAAATLAEDLHSILALPRHTREVRCLSLVELPMVMGDKEARATYATQFIQALSSNGVQEQLERVSPNRAMDTELGTVNVMSVRYWDTISPRQIAEDTSRDYLQLLEAVRNTPARQARLQQIQSVPTFAKSDAKGVEDLMEEVKQSKGVRPENFVQESLTAAEVCNGGTVTVSLAQTESFELSGEVLAQMRLPVFTRAQWKAKLEVGRTTLVGLAKEITIREPEIRKIELKLQKATRELEQILDMLFPKGMLKNIQAFFANPKKKLVALHNSITKCREMARQKLQLTSEVDLLTTARARLQDALNDEERRLESVVNTLRPFVRPAVANGARRIESVDLDEALPRLLVLAEQPNSTEAVMQTLASGVERVTVAGLAEIVGAAQPLLESIAQCLLHGEAPITAPHWGGKKPLERGRVITVLPPVPDYVLEAIRAQVRLVDPAMIIVSGDTAQVGANVVQIEVHHPHEITEIMTQMYQAALADASRIPEQHTDANEGYLAWLFSKLTKSKSAA